MKSIISLFALIVLSNPINLFAQTAGFSVLKKINIPGDGKWDFVTFDESSDRLYISHSTMMQVLDVEKETLVGEVPNTPGIHGIAIVNEVNKGFTSNGKDSTVTVFDLKTMATLKKIKLEGANPDHIIYDRYSKNVFAFDNKSSDVSVINPVTATLIKTVPLNGKPELAVSDEKGLIFVNVEDKNEIVVFDSKTYTIKNRFALSPGEEPTGLALDIKNKRLFSVCANKKMIVLDAITGKLILSLPIGGKVDGVVYDAAQKLIYTSNGEGSVTVIKQKNKDEYEVIANLPTSKGAKTIALDSKRHRIYIPSANFTPVSPTSENPEPKPIITPGTFGVLIIGKK